MTAQTSFVNNEMYTTEWYILSAFEYILNIFYWWIYHLTSGVNLQVWEVFEYVLKKLLLINLSLDKLSPFVTLHYKTTKKSPDMDF